MTDFMATRRMFLLPEGVTYLDGNSLGPLPRAASARIHHVLQEEWGDLLITGWNTAGWMRQPARLGDRIGRLVGAPPGHVMVGDTLSIKVYQALAAALRLRPARRVILSDTGNFPSDLYMAEGLIDTLDKDYELRLVAPEDVADALDADVAVVMLTQVDYRTGRLHDMASLTARAHAAGALTLWDLAHSAGAIEVDLAGTRADFAVGCTYKYLNGGPGAPAFIYVAADHLEACSPALSGWLGHDAPFAFEQSYRAAVGIDRLRVGTPAVLGMAALEAALDVWDSVDMHELRQKSVALSEAFIAQVERRCPSLVLASPRDPAQRGSQISFHFDHGYAAMQACIARGVIGDFRAPDIMRFGITPLYLDFADISHAADVLTEVINTRTWDDPIYRKRNAVT